MFAEEKAAELVRLNDELKREIAERRKAEKELEQRTNLLATLLDVSNLVSSTLDLKPLLESILDRLKKMIPYEDARIMAIDGEYLRIVAHRGTYKSTLADNYTFYYKNISVSKEIVFEKKPVIFKDIHGDEEQAAAFRASLGKYLNTVFKYSRSWMGIPLIMKDKVIGVLTVDKDVPDFYNERHAELGIAFASQAAIEFENARLYNETIKRADELKTMFSVQQAITSRLDRDYVIQLIADEARRLTNSERTAVFLVEGDDLVLSVFSGRDSRNFLGYRLPIKESLMGKSLYEGHSLMIKDTCNARDAYEHLIKLAEVKSFLSVPLIVGATPIGTITVVDKLEGEFNHEDERILSMIASVAVIGMENSRMYEEEQRRHLEDERRRRVAEGLREVLAVLNSNKPVSEILDFILSQSLNLLDTDTAALYRMQSNKGILKIESAKGLPKDYVEGVAIPMGMGLVGQAVALREPIMVSDMKSSLNTHDMSLAPESMKKQLNWLRENFHGMLAVPLVCKDEVYGGIVLYYKEIKYFTQEEIDLAVTFADQTALAIDNARLKAQAEEVAVAAERSRIARDLHDAVTQTLFSSSLIAEVLPKIWERNPEEGKKRLEELRQLTKGALAEMRTLLLELRPSTLLESGLKELLTQLTQAVSGRSRIPICLVIEGKPDLPPEVKIAFYRIVQEALNNITKHSCASSVDIHVTAIGKTPDAIDYVELAIKDDGKGFDIEKVTPEHMGLGIMKERAEAVGAEFSIESCLGEGTMITVSWSALEGVYTDD